MLTVLQYSRSSRFDILRYNELCLGKGCLAAHGREMLGLPCSRFPTKAVRPLYTRFCTK